MRQIVPGAGILKIIQHFFIFATYPARTADAGSFENCIDAIFIEQAARDNFKLQNTYRAQHQIGIIDWFKNLHRALFTELLQTFVQLLDFEWIADAHGAEKVRCKIRYASELQ